MASLKKTNKTSDTKGQSETQQQKADATKNVQAAIDAIKNDAQFMIGTASNWLEGSSKERSLSQSAFASDRIKSIASQLNGGTVSFPKVSVSKGKFIIENGKNGYDMSDVLSVMGAWYERFQTKGYQMGGIPNAGEIFVARENGTPEFVGSFGNKTAVANNDQIVTAVANGVAMANDSLRNAIENQTNVLENAIDRKDLEVNIGDKQIAEANRRGEKGLGQNFIS